MMSNHSCKLDRKVGKGFKGKEISKPVERGCYK